MRRLDRGPLFHLYIFAREKTDRPYRCRRRRRRFKSSRPLYYITFNI